jgi:excisionase family DNA binding protein
MIVGFEVAQAERVGRKQGIDAGEPWLLRPEQVARRLNLSRSRVYELLAEPDGLPSISIGRSRRIRTSDLRDWLAKLG